MFGIKRIGFSGLAALLLPAAALAQSAASPDQPYQNLPSVTVVGTTPLPGVGIDVDKVPSNVQTLTSPDLAREGSPSLLNSAIDQLGSVSFANNNDDQFQPNLTFRGFVASPVLGTPQGIAVYQNGVRVNEGFGDTVNWDLIPDFAIDRFDMLSSNPVYGLNALGGAAVVTMKNGFTFHGFSSETAGGSFGQGSQILQYGQQVGDFAGYIGGRYYQSDGWRQFSPDTLQQLYASAGAHGQQLQLDINFTGANNRLAGEGATPVQELAVGHSLVFTSPQLDTNQLEFVSANASYQATDNLSFQGNAYRREFHQDVINGNTTSYTSCGNGFLCQPDGATPLTSTTGGPIPDLSQGGTVPIGENDSETIRTVGTGGSAQATYTGQIFDHDNNVVVGGSYDHDDISFLSNAEIGTINPSLQVSYSGFFVDTPENTGFTATPVSLTATNRYYGLYATDTFNVTNALAVTLSGRYNLAQVDLFDLRGTNLNGNNRYSRFNPAAGFTYKIFSNLTAYAGYSEGNRVPTPMELECASPTAPCLLPSTLSADPPLKQVVSHTYEAGLRGNFALPQFAAGRFTWNFGLYRTDLDDDIYGVATSISTGFFTNVGSTRRQGIESGLSYRDENWSVYGNYSLVDATFQSSFTLPSSSNPFADASGNIQVHPGDRLPDIPEHQLKVGADYRVTSRWTVGGVLTFFSSQYFLGDESNQNKPIPGYEVVNLHSTYAISENVAMFVNVQNVFDSQYATFGILGDPTGIGAPGVPTNGVGVDPRFLSPAAPLSVYGGVRVTF
jgi:iron complex outermembrane recepter protein